MCAERWSSGLILLKTVNASAACALTTTSRIPLVTEKKKRICCNKCLANHYFEVQCDNSTPNDTKTLFFFLR